MSWTEEDLEIARPLAVLLADGKPARFVISDEPNKLVEPNRVLVEKKVARIWLCQSIRGQFLLPPTVIPFEKINPTCAEAVFAIWAAIGLRGGSSPLIGHEITKMETKENDDTLAFVCEPLS